jgi:hypothetical protein
MGIRSTEPWSLYASGDIHGAATNFAVAPQAMLRRRHRRPPWPRKARQERTLGGTPERSGDRRSIAVAVGIDLSVDLVGRVR